MISVLLRVWFCATPHLVRWQVVSTPGRATNSWQWASTSSLILALGTGQHRVHRFTELLIGHLPPLKSVQ